MPKRDGVKSIHQVFLIIALMSFAVPRLAFARSSESCSAGGDLLNLELKQAAQSLKSNFVNPPERNFNYLDHPEITRAFKPNTLFNGKDISCELGESEESMQRMHEMINAKSVEYGMDPAVVYIISLGESRADPFIHSGGHVGSNCVKNGVAPKWNGKSAYYSMFQFGSSKHKNNLDKMIKENLGKPPEGNPLGAPMGVREIVIEYYFENYVKGKKLKGLTPLQQIALLDLGNPGATGAMLNKLKSRGYGASGANALYQDLTK